MDESVADPNETGTMWAEALTLSKLSDRFRAQAWREYVEIVRDERDALLLWFKL